MMKPILAMLLLSMLLASGLAQAEQDICPQDFLDVGDYLSAVEKQMVDRGCGNIVRSSFSSDKSFQKAWEKQGCEIASYCTKSREEALLRFAPSSTTTADVSDASSQTLLQRYLASKDHKLYASCSNGDFAAWGEKDIYHAYRSVAKRIGGHISIPSGCTIRYVNNDPFELKEVSWHDPSARYRSSSGNAVLLTCEYGFKVFAASFSGGETALQMAISKARKQGLRECKADENLQPKLEAALAAENAKKSRPKASYKRDGPDPSSMVACEQYSQLVYNHIMGNRTPPPMRQVVVVNQRRPTEYEGTITSCGMFSCTVELRETYRSSWNRQIRQTSDNLGQSFYELGRAIGQAAARNDLRRKAEKRKKNEYQQCLNAAGYAANGPNYDPLDLHVTNINNHTRGAQFYSSFTLTHRNGTKYKLDVKPNSNGYKLNRYRDTVFRATDKTTGQEVDLTVEASAWR